MCRGSEPAASSGGERASLIPRLVSAGWHTCTHVTKKHTCAAEASGGIQHGGICVAGATGRGWLLGGRGGVGGGGGRAVTGTELILATAAG